LNVLVRASFHWKEIAENLLMIDWRIRQVEALLQVIDVIDGDPVMN